MVDNIPTSSASTYYDSPISYLELQKRKKELEEKNEQLKTKIVKLNLVVDAVKKYTLSKEYKDREIIDKV